MATNTDDMHFTAYLYARTIMHLYRQLSRSTSYLMHLMK
jgi:hypothetical protein